MVTHGHTRAADPGETFQKRAFVLFLNTDRWTAVHMEGSRRRARPPRWEGSETTAANRCRGHTSRTRWSTHAAETHLRTRTVLQGREGFA